MSTGSIFVSKLDPYRILLFDSNVFNIKDVTVTMNSTADIRTSGHAHCKSYAHEIDAHLSRSRHTAGVYPAV